MKKKKIITVSLVFLFLTVCLVGGVSSLTQISYQKASASQVQANAAKFIVTANTATEQPSQAPSKDTIPNESTVFSIAFISFVLIAGVALISLIIWLLFLRKNNYAKNELLPKVDPILSQEYSANPFTTFSDPKPLGISWDEPEKEN